MLLSIPFYGQDSITIDRYELRDILLSESKYKAETKLLEKDTLNLGLIIKGKDVIIKDYVKVVSNNEEVIIGLQNALKSVKDAYKDQVKKSKWKQIIRFLEGMVVGAAVLFGVMVLN